jgi:hypothetical protein
LQSCAAVADDDRRHARQDAWPSPAHDVVARLPHWGGEVKACMHEVGARAVAFRDERPGDLGVQDPDGEPAA